MRNWGFFQSDDLVEHEKYVQVLRTLVCFCILRRAMRDGKRDLPPVRCVGCTKRKREGSRDWWVSVVKATHNLLVFLVGFPDGGCISFLCYLQKHAKYNTKYTTNVWKVFSHESLSSQRSLWACGARSLASCTSGVSCALPQCRVRVYFFQWCLLCLFFREILIDVFATCVGRHRVPHHSPRGKGGAEDN